MAKSISIKALQEEHSFLYYTFESLCKEIEHQLHHLIDNEKIRLAVPIQYRAKSWKSISDKIEQKRFNIKKSVTELQDLAGIRIILMFSRDVKTVTNLIDSNFKTLKKYNNEDRLGDDQFGYSSIHIVTELIEEWLKIPTFSKFKGMKIEFQIRTLSQHSWAEASNILQYKQEDNVPKPLKRSISRISALLETVDLEYERLLTDRSTYKIEINDQSIEEIDAKLNVDLLQKILNERLPIANKVNSDNYSDLLENLQDLNFESSLKLINLIKEHKDVVIKEDQEIAKELYTEYQIDKSVSNMNYFVGEEDIQRIKNGVFLSHSGLIRQMLTLELKMPYYKALLSNKKKEQK